MMKLKVKDRATEKLEAKVKALGEPTALSAINQQLEERRRLSTIAQGSITRLIDHRWKGYQASEPPLAAFAIHQRVIFGFPSSDPRSKVFEPSDALGRPIPWLKNGAIGTIMFTSANGPSHGVQLDQAPRNSPSLISNQYLVSLDAIAGTN